MKKILTTACLALGMMLIYTHEASAWINFKVGANVGMDWQTADNSFGWKLWRNGQIPAPPGYHGPLTPPVSAQQGFGHGHGVKPMILPNQGAVQPALPVPMTPPALPAPSGAAPSTIGNEFAPVRYTQPYTMPGYYYPTYNNYPYAPSYYGR